LIQSSLINNPVICDHLLIIEYEVIPCSMYNGILVLLSAAGLYMVYWVLNTLPLQYNELFVHLQCQNKFQSMAANYN